MITKEYDPNWVPKKRTRAYRSPNEVYVLKSQALALPNKKAMFILYLTKQGKARTTEGFRRTLFRVSSIETWNKLIEDLEKNNPGDLIDTTMIGYPEKYLIYLNHLHCTRVYFRKHMITKFRKALHLKDFIEKFIYEEKMGYKDSYSRVTDEGLNVSDYEKFEDDKWYTFNIRTFEVGRPRKQPKVIQ